MLKKISFSLIVLLASALLFGAVTLTSAEERGRQLPSEGTVEKVKGTLMGYRGEWFLRAVKETYLLHFGDRAYLAGTGIPLSEGKEIDVEGEVFGEDIVVFGATMNGKTYAFRDKDGQPLWAPLWAREGRGPWQDDGRGYGKGPWQDDERGCGRRPRSGGFRSGGYRFYDGCPRWDDDDRAFGDGPRW